MVQPLYGSSGQQIADLIREADSLSISDPEKALPVIEKALELSLNEGDMKMVADAELVTANVYYYLSDLEGAIEHYRKANELFQEQEGTKSYHFISTLGYIGNCHLDLKEYISAYEYFEQALSYARNAALYDEIAANLANLGVILTIWGDYGKAIEVMEEALEIDLEHHGEEVAATDYNTIGKIYSYWGQPEKAVQYYEKALEIDRRLKNDNKVSIRLNSIGTVYKDMGEYDLALKYFFEALEIDSLAGLKDKVAVRLHNIGHTLYLKGDYQEARAYLNQAESIFRELKDPVNLASTLYTLGGLYHEMNEYARARLYLEEGLTMARTSRLQHQEQKILETLAEVYYHLGMPSRAYFAQRSQDSVSNVLFSQENSRQLGAFDARYKVKEASDRAEMFRQEASLKKKRLIIMGILSSSIIVILIAVVMVIRLRAITIRQEKELTEQKALALRQELELRNKELTLSAMNIMKNNETMLSISAALQTSMAQEENSESIRTILGTLRSAEHSTNWEDFEKRFTQVHQDFYGRLDEKFPDLSPNERRLCAYLKLNMTTKEIASITFQSVKSINVARTRLRKKLGLANTDQNISTFLADL
jgi:tetratricopeptide (TPR) repeat protein/DNA-binding CsgD family transcriptional regulator